MKKYNKSEIMRRAWRWYHAGETDTFRESLKMSWAKAKIEPTMNFKVGDEVRFLNNITGTERSIYKVVEANSSIFTIYRNGISSATGLDGLRNYLVFRQIDGANVSFGTLKQLVHI